MGQYPSKKGMTEKEYKSAYYRANLAKWKAYKIKWNTAHPEKILFQSAKQRAKKKGLEFTIVESDISIPSRCPILGIPIVIDWQVDREKRNRPNSPSLDRINNARGYTPDNIEVVSWRANEIKRNATAAELYMVADYMSKQDR